MVDVLSRVCASEIFLIADMSRTRLTEEREQLTATGAIV